MWSKGNTPALLVGMQTCTATLKISMAVSQKLGILLAQDLGTLLGHIPKLFTVIPQGHLLTYAHSSIIHNNQNLETT